MGLLSRTAEQQSAQKQSAGKIFFSQKKKNNLVYEIIGLLFSLVQDICLAEVALSLLLSGDVSLPDMKPGSLSLSVRTLMAELHEGLFLGPLLLPSSPQKSMQSPAGKPTHIIVSDLPSFLSQIIN